MTAWVIPMATDDAAVRGNGVGLEVTREVVRGVRLGVSAPGEPIAAAEVAIRHDADDRSLVDALVRLHAELDQPDVPTRVATFPSGSILQRRDVTGMSGPELTTRRVELDRTRGISSTVLVEVAVRRWLVAVGWDEDRIRRLERLVERAGFRDVTIDPSPLALSRVLPDDATRVRRHAAAGESFEYCADGRVPLAAATVDPIGAQPPELLASGGELPSGWFEDFDDDTSMAMELSRIVGADLGTDLDVVIGERPVARYPPADLRSPARQCVAIGAAAGAAGLAGRLGPVDMIPRAATQRPHDELDRPWAIERVSNLPIPHRPTIGRGRRWLARVLPRRR